MPPTPAGGSRQRLRRDPASGQFVQAVPLFAPAGSPPPALRQPRHAPSGRSPGAGGTLLREGLSPSYASAVRSVTLSPSANPRFGAGPSASQAATLQGRPREAAAGGGNAFSREIIGRLVSKSASLIFTPISLFTKAAYESKCLHFRKCHIPMPLFFKMPNLNAMCF